MVDPETFSRRIDADNHMMRLPIPKGPIFDWIKSEYRGEGHEAKKTLVNETADLANKILASYTFYIEEPEDPAPEYRERFREDIETYGKRAVEVRKFALQSDAPRPSESEVERMSKVQEVLTESRDEFEEVVNLLDEPVERLDLNRRLPEMDPKSTVDDFFNKIDDDLYLMFYSILERMVGTCVDYSVTREVDTTAFEELKLSLRVAMRRS